MIANLIARCRRRRMTTLKPFGPLAPDELRLTIGDINSEVAKALSAAFDSVAGVEIVCGNLLDAACDGIVSPANSFGDMGGGIDKAIDDLHRGEAQRQVMAAIAEQHCGELPLGAALVVELSAQRLPFFVAAPTMRFAGNVQGTVNAYLSMRGALVAVLRHNRDGGRRIRHLAIPGLGTGVGGLGYAEAAEQMRAAYDNIMGGEWREIVHAAQAPFVMGIGWRSTRRS
jgi:O-acetyl-ADP-ribose deacetylase (regulator of RNase III)